MTQFRKVETGSSHGGFFMSIPPSTNSGYISADAYKKWFQDAETVDFLISEDEEELAIRPAGDSGDITLTEKGKEYSASLSVRGLLSDLDVPMEEIEETVRIPLEENDDGLITGSLEPLYDEVYYVCECGNKYLKKGDLQHHRVNEHIEDKPEWE